MRQSEKDAELAEINRLGLLTVRRLAEAIYVVCPAGSRKPAKIGICRNPKKRLITLRVGSFTDIKMPYILWVRNFPEARGVELACHAELKEQGKHVRGEWFDVSGEDAFDIVQWTILQLGLETFKHPSEIPPRHIWKSYDEIEVYRRKHGYAGARRRLINRARALGVDSNLAKGN